jgi:hypothetical protein
MCLLLAAASACAAREPDAAPPARAELRVLFVGNSLTEGNDLPHLVQAMAAAGKARLHVSAVTPGGFSLEDHWNGGNARKALAEGKWDFVVLQQGPSARPESQVNLKQWAKTWADEIRKQGAKPALYMVWPFAGQRNGPKDVSHSYRAAAKASDAKILPAGEAWQAALARDPQPELYQADLLHPTPEGSYLAALVITHGLTGVAPKAVPAKLRLASGREFAIPEDKAEELRRAAEKVTGQ